VIDDREYDRWMADEVHPRQIWKEVDPKAGYNHFRPILTGGVLIEGQVDLACLDLKRHVPPRHVPPTWVLTLKLMQLSA
jgi:hypothetical protein